MESKKINQLATELTPALSDLTIIGDPTTGISKKITLSQMASLFTGTVEEYANVAAFPLVGVADTIYIALDTNVLYRWDTGLTSYVELSPNIINSLVFSDANGFDGNISLVGSVATLTITTALTQGSVPFIGTSGALSQDNANLFFDDTNNRLGINTNAPTTALDVFGSGIIGRLNGTSTNNAFLGFASAGSNKWSIGNVQSDHRFRIYNEATTSELISVLSSGEFGIGIANPTTKLHIDGGASALIANLDANVSVAKSISFRSDNSNRINLEVSGTESGSNAGANFFIRRYSDAGALIDTPLTITRSTGAATFSSTIRSNDASGLGIGSIAGYRRLQYDNSITTFGFLTDSNSLANIEASAANFTSSISTTQININSASTANSIIAGVNSQTNNPRIFLTSNESTNVNTILSTSSTGSDNLSIGIGGSNLLFLRAGGKVGIGTNTPTAKLEIQNSPASDWGISVWGNTTTGQSFGGIIRGGTDSSDVAFRVNNAANILTYFSVQGQGNVLIGTSTDNGAKLQINGGTSGTKFNTFTGNVSVANNTATFLQACGADGGTASMYLIIAAVGGGGDDRIAMGILVTVSQGGGTARWAFQNNGGNMFLTDPSNNGNVFVRHTIGGTQTINYSVLRIA
jgi:hypothetical protein